MFKNLKNLQKKHLFLLAIVGLLLGVRPAYGFVTMDFDPWYGYVGTVSYASSEQYGNGFAVSEIIAHELLR